MHQVLYRKWRPKTFSEVYGQEHITSVLRYEVKEGKTAHAYLFCGSRGTGKTTCAKILAKAVNCLDPQDGEPCGKCPICRGIDNGSVTDVLEMDAASNNGVDDIRTIREEVVYPPASARYRVYIIDEVHMLSLSAFNALLKTLEEPPPQVIFILATTELQKLPSTIVSRCRRFDFRRISQPDLCRRLHEIADAEGITLEKDAALLIARAAQGGMRDAVSLLDLCSSEGRPVTPAVVRENLGIAGRDTLQSTADAILRGDIDALFGIVAEMYSSSRDIASFWQDLSGYYRDLLVIKAARNARDYLDLTEEDYRDSAEMASRYTAELILWISTVLDEAFVSMQKGVISKRLCAELNLVRLAKRMEDSPAALSARLSLLEDRLSRGVTAAPAEPTVPVRESPVPESAPQPSEQSGTAPQTSPAPAEKKLRTLPYWIEVVHKFERQDAANGAFLRGTQALCADGGSILTVRAPNALTVMMLQRCKAQILDALASFGSFTDVEFTVAQHTPDEDYSSIDEIQQNISEQS